MDRLSFVEDSSEDSSEDSEGSGRGVGLEKVVAAHTDVYRQV